MHVTSQPSPHLSAHTLDGAGIDQTPRVLYIDADDDLPALLDRVEEAGTPAIVVLPEGARAARGVVAARLLKRRAEAAGISVVVVTTDRTAVAQLNGIGIPTAPTVGEARTALPGGAASPPDPLDNVDWDEEDEDDQQPSPGPDLDAEDSAPPTPSPVPVSVSTRPLRTARGANAGTPPDEPQVLPAPARVARTPGRSRIRRILVAAVTLLLLALLALAAWVAFFPSAAITISYAEQPFDRTYRVPLADGMVGGIPLYHTHLTSTAAKDVAGTGAMLVADGHATGTVALANPHDGYVIVAAGTIVDAANGSHFVTTEDVRVPGAVHSFSGSTNGQASIPVRALTGGTAGNVPAGSIVNLEGRLSHYLLITNYTAFTGGTMRTVYTLTAADLAAPVGPLRRKLIAAEHATLEKKYALSPVRMYGSTRTVGTHVTRFTRNGRPYARVSLTVSTDLAYVHAADVKHYAVTRRNAELAGRNQRVLAGTQKLHIATHGSGAATVLVISLHARTSPSIDVANLQALLVGRTLAEARQLLDGSARNGGWRYTLHTSPDWARRMPEAAGLIHITVQRSG